VERMSQFAQDPISNACCYQTITTYEVIYLIKPHCVWFLKLKTVRHLDIPTRSYVQKPKGWHVARYRASEARSVAR